MLATFSQFAAFASGSLVAAIWQGLLLAACVALCLRLLPNLSAAARSIIWTAVLVLGIALHVTPLFAAHTASAPHASLHVDPRWSLAVASIWAVLTLYRIAQLAVSAIRLHTIARRSTAVESIPTLQQGTRRARLCLSEDIDRPSVAGFFSPRVLLPPALFHSLTREELDQVLLHEMEHLHRRDDWTNLLQKLTLALFPLNPVLLWVERRLCLERELACDDRVLEATRARKAYATCLTNLAGYGILQRTASLALGAWERQSELARRVHRILAYPETAFGRTTARSITASLILALATGATFLSRSPEFVTFAPQAHAISAAIPSTEFTALPYRDSSTHAKMVNAKAILPEPQSSTKPLKTRHRQAKSAQSRSVSLRSANRSQPRSWVMLTDWHELPAARVILTGSGDQQFSYAALPTPAGWLIVQL